MIYWEKGKDIFSWGWKSKLAICWRIERECSSIIKGETWNIKRKYKVKLSDYFRETRWKERSHLSRQIEENKLKIIQEFENKVKCFSEVKMEVYDQLMK